MARQSERIWNTILVPFFTYLFLFVGMGLVAGSVVHFGQTDQIHRFLSIGLVGMVLFVIGSYMQESLLNTERLRREGVVKYVFYSLLLAVGIGMISGGTQHFLDFPVYASYLLPVGFVLALVAYVLRNHLNLSRKGWIVLLAGALLVALPAFLGLNLYAKALPPSQGHHHGASHETENQAVVQSGGGQQALDQATTGHGSADQSPIGSHSASPASSAPGAGGATSTAVGHSHDSDPSHSHSHSPVESHSPMKSPVKTVMTLSGLSKLSLSQPVQLQVTVLGEDGRPIQTFEPFQEKLMHFIAVSNDLALFEHLHPVYLGNGQFEVSAPLSRPGGYTVFSDYKPAGQSEQVSTLQLTQPGALPNPPAPDFTRQRSVGGVQTRLQVSPAQPQPGEEVTLTFTLTDTANQPAQNLRPYLGEKGHLVIVRQAQPLTESDYLHVHALKQGAANQITFKTVFPAAGRYKLWQQFDQGREIKIADFWVQVGT